MNMVYYFWDDADHVLEVINIGTRRKSSLVTGTVMLTVEFEEDQNQLIY